MIEFLDLKKVTASFEPELSRAVQRTVMSGHYLLGPEVERFERSYSEYIGTTHAVACGSGLDALILMLQALIIRNRLSPGDEVIVPANTYIATILAITECGLRPVLAEPSLETLEIDAEKLEALVSPRTRALMMVHLYGRCACSEELLEFCNLHNLILLEDNAQSHGCRYGEKRTGSLGVAAAHSFYPGKNLGALGDGGAVTTSDKDLADIVRALANYGSHKKYVFKYCGRNSRLDELQAAVLNVKLPRLDADNDARRAIARIYLDNIRNPLLRVPSTPDMDANVFHLFPIFCDCRDILQQFLAANGVKTLIHYPIPPHRQECYAGEKYRDWSRPELPVTEEMHRTELSLPISPVMTDVQALEVVRLLNKFS